MTGDEVLAFKQLYYRKSDPDGVYKANFHTAFKDPREKVTKVKLGKLEFIKES